MNLRTLFWLPAPPKLEHSVVGASFWQFPFGGTPQNLSMMICFLLAFFTVHSLLDFLFVERANRREATSTESEVWNPNIYWIKSGPDA